MVIAGRDATPGELIVVDEQIFLKCIYMLFRRNYHLVDETRTTMGKLR